MSRTPTKRRGPMGGHGGMGMSVEKAKDFKGTMKTLWSYLSSYKFAIILVVVFAIGSTIFSIVGPKILGNATTELFNGLMDKLQGGSGINFGKIGEILLFLIGLYVVSASFSFIQGFIMTNVSQKLTYRLRKNISKKIGRMPMRYFDGQTHGEVLSRITNDIDTLSQSLNQSITQLITSATMLVGILVMMFSINWIMTLVSLLILPISLGIITKIIKKSQKHFKAQQEYLGHVNGQVEEVYGGHNVVKAFNSEKKVTEEFQKANEVLYGSAWKSQFLSGMMMPIMNFVSNVGYVAVAVLGGVFSIQGIITVGNIQSFIQYNKMFTQPIQQIAQVSNLFQSTAAAAERVFEFLDEAEEDQTVENPVSIINRPGDVEFENVKFGYLSNKTIINDFSAHVKAGQKVAIVGPTGAGKTTLINLLMRFYDVDGGSILVDGVDTKEMTRHELRDRFGMVLQDAWLFEGSIRDNIAYAQDNLPEEKIIAAARSASVDSFIKTLPDGYDFELSTGAENISQGQRQLLTIARAMASDPEIMILDEATSNVDTHTEQLIQKALAKLMHGRTSFVIAHRLSTIRDADMILYMEHGDILEHGSHEELMAQHGKYEALYMSQFAQ